MFKTLIDPSTLAAHLADPNWVVIDCRFDLADPPKGEQLYLQSHILGARYAHLDRDLSGTKTGANGRHPLPTADEMRARFGALGIAPGRQVVVYDADSGMHASRLWWMLRYLRHEAVALLDGGFARWVREPATERARDVNGDGTDDIVWQGSTGQVHYWRMSNGRRLEGINIDRPVTKDWKFGGVGSIE